MNPTIVKMATILRPRELKIAGTITNAGFAAKIAKTAP